MREINLFLISLFGVNANLGKFLTETMTKFFQIFFLVWFCKFNISVMVEQVQVSDLFSCLEFRGKIPLIYMYIVFRISRIVIQG